MTSNPEAVPGRSLLLMTTEEILLRFAAVLSVTPLPDGKGATRTCDAGEFMLMGSCANQASFKHRDSRNYVHLFCEECRVPPGDTDGPALSDDYLLVPMGPVAFCRGTFELWEPPKTDVVPVARDLHPLHAFKPYFHEADCSGVFDGSNTVHSDADPGL